MHAILSVQYGKLVTANTAAIPHMTSENKYGHSLLWYWRENLMVLGIDLPKGEQYWRLFVPSSFLY